MKMNCRVHWKFGELYMKAKKRKNSLRKDSRPDGMKAETTSFTNSVLPFEPVSPSVTLKKKKKVQLAAK